MQRPQTVLSVFQ
ncbi:unnamed protein product, partial [Adineta steineri]